MQRTVFLEHWIPPRFRHQSACGAVTNVTRNSAKVTCPKCLSAVRAEARRTHEPPGGSPPKP